MQTFQMAILLLFENTLTMTCSEIVNTLQLNWDQFLKNCVTLVECKILLANTKVPYYYYYYFKILGKIKSSRTKHFFFLILYRN